jgi:glycerol 2-dehydrogenase (NADP+)
MSTLNCLHYKPAVTYLRFIENDPFPIGADGNIIMEDKITFNDSYAAMEKALEAGKVKAIGVSNFSIPKFVTHLPSDV